MTKVESHRSEQHPKDCGSLVEMWIDARIAIPLIANDGVPNVLQMSADLMRASGQRLDLQEGKA
jgi:hypothetical protein